MKKKNTEKNIHFIEFGQIMHKLCNLYLDTDSDTNKVGEIEDELNEWGCRAFSGHKWVHDQCGRWQHQFCVHCGVAKYKDLATISCSILDKTMNKIKEDEYWENLINYESKP